MQEWKVVRVCLLTVPYAPTYVIKGEIICIWALVGVSELCCVVGIFFHGSAGPCSFSDTTSLLCSGNYGLICIFRPLPYSDNCKYLLLVAFIFSQLFFIWGLVLVCLPLTQKDWWLSRINIKMYLWASLHIFLVLKAMWFHWFSQWLPTGHKQCLSESFAEWHLTSYING